MKQIAKLTKEEQQELISYTSPNTGITVYYSNINTIGQNDFMYDGEHVTDILEEILQTIREGKTRYETYKLQHMKSDADLVMKEQTLEAIKEYFEKDVKEITETFSNLYTTLSSELSTAALDAKAAVRSIKSIDVSISKTNISGIEDKFKTVVDGIDKAKIKFTELNTELQSLFVK